VTAGGEVDAILERVTTWASRRADVRGLMLVGSWARGEPGADSDVDIVLLSTEPARYAERDDWLEELGPVRLVRTASWGVITERRLALPGGLEVELGVGPPSWAADDPVDPGTRRVVERGARPLYDPDGALARLVAACTPQ
jgi:predicted nucleotidyltransferase